MSFLCFHSLSNHRFRKLCKEMRTEQPNNVVLCLPAGNLLIGSTKCFYLYCFFIFKQNAVPDERWAVIGSLKKGGHATASSQGRFLKERKPSSGSVLARPHILAIVIIVKNWGVKFPLYCEFLPFDIKRTCSSEMHLKIRFAGNSISKIDSSFREKVNVRQHVLYVYI